MDVSFSAERWLSGGEVLGGSVGGVSGCLYEFLRRGVRAVPSGGQDNVCWLISGSLDQWGCFLVPQWSARLRLQ